MHSLRQCGKEQLIKRGLTKLLTTSNDASSLWLQLRAANTEQLSHLLIFTQSYSNTTHIKHRQQTATTKNYLLKTKVQKCNGLM